MHLKLDLISRQCGRPYAAFSHNHTRIQGHTNTPQTCNCAATFTTGHCCHFFHNIHNTRYVTSQHLLSTKSATILPCSMVTLWNTKCTRYIQVFHPYVPSSHSPNITTAYKMHEAPKKRPNVSVMWSTCGSDYQ